MPVHDWTRVEAGVFHHFHHAWIEEISRALNAGILPPEFYALSEQHAAGFGPDVLALESEGEAGKEMPLGESAGSGGLLLAPPKQPVTAETARNRTARASIRNKARIMAVVLLQRVAIS